jgi:hypothetical protein
VNVVTRLIGLLRRRPEAALAIGVAGMAAIILGTLLWSEETHRWRPAINCERSPALGTDGAKRAMYLVRLNATASPEDACNELQREVDRLREVPTTPSESRSGR